MNHAARDSALIVSLRNPASAEVQGDDAGASVAREADRLRTVVADHYAALWRFLRRLGVSEADAEDAAQKCLCVFSERIADIAPGKDKAFLFGVALRVAKTTRREGRAGPLRVDGSGDDWIAELPAPDPDAGELLDDRRARALLDALLASLPIDLRTVFILYEVEELTMAEIGRVLEMPMGTVASRLRRAREAFEERSRRIQRDLRAKEGLR